MSLVGNDAHVEVDFHDFNVVVMVMVMFFLTTVLCCLGSCVVIDWQYHFRTRPAATGRPDDTEPPKVLIPLASLGAS
jgi:hypothetical protein